MKNFTFVILSFCLCSCKQKSHQKPQQVESAAALVSGKTYHEIKDDIHNSRKRFAERYPSLSAPNNDQSLAEICNFWVDAVGNDLFKKWEHTRWDYNGTTDEPKQGAIACGYFVTTVLRDMGLKINRGKLAICPSSVMMKSLTPRQKINNLSNLSYPDFNDALTRLGKGVYIIGLDFHTGFIVNDGTENWFIHSYFVQRVGVIKESVLNSMALRSSKTRWLVSLTADKTFLSRWLRG